MTKPQKIMLRKLAWWGEEGVQLAELYDDYPDTINVALAWRNSDRVASSLFARGWMARDESGDLVVITNAGREALHGRQ